MFHMPLFIFCSGYFFRRPSTGNNLKVKLLKILKPFLFFTVFLILLDLVVYSDIGVHDWILTGSAGPLWYLLAYAYIFAIYNLICLGANRLNTKLNRDLIIGSVCFIITGIGFMLSIYGIRIPLYIDSAISLLWFFHLGRVYAIKYEQKIKPVLNKSLPLVILLSAGMLILLYNLCFANLQLTMNDLYVNQIMENFVLYIISAVAGFMLIFSISYWISRVNFLNKICKVLSILGISSMYIFALHMGVFKLGDHFWGVLEPDVNILYKLIMIATALAVCLISEKILVKHVPYVFAK